MAPLKRILSLLPSARRTQTGWVACCPAHPDRNPSLSLGESDAGAALLHCHAGCATDAVVAALGLELGDLFPPTPSQPKPPPPDSRPMPAAILRILDECSDDVESIATYLRSRGLSGSVPAVLRSHAALGYYQSGERTGTFPAMVAPVVDVAGTLRGIHCTYLAADSSGKAPVTPPRKLRASAPGATRGAAIRLGEPANGLLGLAEGIETALAVQEATGCPTWAAISAGGLEAVELPASVTTLLIWADHDANGTGQRAAEACAARLHSNHAVSILLPPTVGQDWLDVFRTAGASALVEAVERAAPWTPLATEPLEPAPRFRLLSDEDVVTLPAPNPLVTGLLAIETFNVLYGAPGTAKSFFALDLALSVASGRLFLGHAVRRGPVVYIAAEGVAGLGIRIRAWKQVHRFAGRVGVSFLTTAANLLDRGDTEALLAILRTLKEAPVLLVVDTLARCLVGGDENSAKDVGEAVAALDRIRTALGCAVLVLHHSAKHVDMERGSSALRGAADAMLALTKDGEAVSLRCEKDKNSAPFPEKALRLCVVTLEDGDTSCALEPGAPPVTDLSGSRLKVLGTLHELFRDDGATYTELVRTGIAESTLRRALEELVDAGYVGKPPKLRGGKYTATEAGIAAIEALTAKPRGGDFTQQTQGESAHRHLPPTSRQGGINKSPPPPSPPYRGDGVAVSGGAERERQPDPPHEESSRCSSCGGPRDTYVPALDALVCGECHDYGVAATTTRATFEP